VEEIQSHIYASDDTDGNLTSSIYVVLDNYTANKTVLGDYNIIFGVTNSNGLESTITVTVRNIDVNAPEIIINDEFSLNIPVGTEFNTALLNISAIDSFEGDVSDNIIILGTIDTSTFGTYTFTVTSSDSSGNEVSQTINLQVVDASAPTLEGPTEIIKNASYILDSEFYLDYFEAMDNIDGDLTSNITVVSNDYVGNANTKGTYTVVLRVEDSAGNPAQKELIIIVKEEFVPLIVIDKYDITLANGTSLTDKNIIDLLKSFDDIPNDSFTLTNINDEYTENSTVLGTYLKSISLHSASGQDYDRDITINVIDYDHEVFDADPTTFEEAIVLLKKWWWVLGIVILIGVGLIKGR